MKRRERKERYWNTEDISKIKKLYGTDVLNTKKCIEQYIKAYPDDYNGWFFYIEVLITLQEYDLAGLLLKEVCIKYKQDPVNISKPKKMKHYEDLEEETKIRYYLATHQYDDALDYIEYSETLKAYLILELKIYCMNKLGIKSSTYSETYNCKQMVNYSEEEALKEMKQRMDAVNNIPDYYLEKRFSYNFPLEKVFEEVKKKLTDENKLCFGYYNDTYVFKYDLCGRINGKIQDFFKVSCFHDTHDIIIMYPTFNCENQPYIDLNYLNESEKPIQKRISQIDRFNKRYAKREK